MFLCCCLTIKKNHYFPNTTLGKTDHEKMESELTKQQKRINLIFACLPSMGNIDMTWNSADIEKMIKLQNNINQKLLVDKLCMCYKNSLACLSIEKSVVISTVFISIYTQRLSQYMLTYGHQNNIPYTIRRCGNFRLPIKLFSTRYQMTQN